MTPSRSASSQSPRSARCASARGCARAPLGSPVRPRAPAWPRFPLLGPAVESAPSGLQRGFGPAAGGKYLPSQRLCCQSGVMAAWGGGLEPLSTQNPAESSNPRRPCIAQQYWTVSGLGRKGVSSAPFVGQSLPLLTACADLVQLVPDHERDEPTPLQEASSPQPKRSKSPPAAVSRVLSLEAPFLPPSLAALTPVWRHGSLSGKA